MLLHTVAQQIVVVRTMRLTPLRFHDHFSVLAQATSLEVSSTPFQFSADCSTMGLTSLFGLQLIIKGLLSKRSEERRVGKECLL